MSDIMLKNSTLLGVAAATILFSLNLCSAAASEEIAVGSSGADPIKFARWYASLRKAVKKMTRGLQWRK